MRACYERPTSQPRTAYALATRCPVLTFCKLLSAYAHAMPGTDLAATCLRAVQCPVLSERMLLPASSLRGS
eukprot:1000565-Rhodomonas_salina.1